MLRDTIATNHQLAYSPDGKWLAAAQIKHPRHDCTTRQLLRRKRLTKAPGVESATCDSRPMVGRCAASTATALYASGTRPALNFLRRFSIPAGCIVGDIRPSDGQYAMCSDVVDPTRPIQVVDLDDGKSVCQVKLPLTWKVWDVPRKLACVNRVYWLSNQEKALCAGWFLGAVPAATSIGGVSIIRLGRFLPKVIRARFPHEEFIMI